MEESKRPRIEDETNELEGGEEDKKAPDQLIPGLDPLPDVTQPPDELQPHNR